MIPDALDLLTISVRAGLGFDAALGKVVEKLKGPLTEEFRRALAEVRVGKARRDALRDIVPRTEVQALTNFIGAIIQAEQLGVSISKVLQVQSEQLRIERRQRAEEMAAKAPIKMLFPLVGCIFPSLFIVILGPGDHPHHDQPPAPRRSIRWRRTPPTGVARNVERSTLLAERLETAGSLWAKFKGLMGRQALPPGDGLWLPASNGIHMMFMRFPIDAVFVTKADPAGVRRVRSRAPVAGRVDGPRAADPRRRRRPGAPGRDHRRERHRRGRPRGDRRAPEAVAELAQRRLRPGARSRTLPVSAVSRPGRRDDACSCGEAMLARIASSPRLWRWWRPRRWRRSAASAPRQA